MNKRGIWFVLLVILLTVFVEATDIPQYENILVKGDFERNPEERFDLVTTDLSEGDDQPYGFFGNNLGSHAGVGCEDGVGWPADLHYQGCYVFSVDSDGCG